MDGTFVQLAAFLAATFVAATVTGVTGFAFAIIAASVWLHVLTPLETAMLTVSYGLVVQSYGAWKVRHAVNWSRVWPFVLGGAPGAAIGALVLRWANPAHMRIGIAAFLVLYSIYGLARPALKPVRVAWPADAVVGLLSGMLGAMAGFPGILVVIWCGMRGWNRDEQRAVFQPAAVALQVLAAAALASTGPISRHTIELFLIGLPALAAGTWVGFKLYGRLDEAMFRRIVLMLLLASGLLLIASFK
jgi:uncharacterized membrane protein YfcA